jgi:type II secretory pathway pseudopilin PulG
MKPLLPARAGVGGFTLIEVSLGMAILILIFGVIFQLVQYSVLGAEAARQISVRNREVSGLMALVRQTCLDLSPKSTLSLVAREGKGCDLVFSNAPSLILPADYRGIRVAEFFLRKNDRGSQDLWLAERTMETNRQGGLSPTEPPNRFLLLQDVLSLDWTVWDTRDRQPKGQWAESNKPGVLQLRMSRREGRQERFEEGWFWIPTGLGPNGQVPRDPRTVGNTNASPGTNATNATNVNVQVGTP